MGKPFTKRRAFWAYARVLLEYPRSLVASFVFAGLSAIGLGVGILGIVAAFSQVLRTDDDGGRETLAQQIRDATSTGVAGWVSVPEPWLEMLPTDPYRTLVVLVVGLGVLTMLGAMANFLHLYFSMTLCTVATAKVRRDAFEHVIAAPLLGSVTATATDTVSRVVQDATVLERGFRALTSRALAQVTKGTAALGAAFVMNWKLTLITLTVAPVLAVVIRKLGKRIRRASRGAMRGRAELLSSATEVLQGFRVVKVYGGEARELERFDRGNETVVRQELRARVARAITTPVVEFLSLVVVGTLALVAGKAIIDDALSLEEAVGVLGALGMAGNALKPLTSVVQDIQTADAAAQRLEGLMGERREREGACPAMPRHAESVRFDGVVFSYPGAEGRAVDGVTLEVEAGTVAAFVGPNGCGKTTLLSMVPGLLVPDAGRVLIDGRDVVGHDLGSLRAQIGVVTQEVVLFRGTIGENVAYSKPEAGAGEVEDALRRAHADFVFELPGGIDAEVGERGMSLSGGQRQRLAIARAILRDPAILIMDEATSMIDADSEAKITAALRAFSAGRTVLTVAHRLSTVRHADVIFVMEGGRVVARGTHEELLATSGLYESLARHQLAGTGEA